MVSIKHWSELAFVGAHRKPSPARGLRFIVPTPRGMTNKNTRIFDRNVAETCSITSVVTWMQKNYYSEQFKIQSHTPKCNENGDHRRLLIIHSLSKTAMVFDELVFLFSLVNTRFNFSLSVTFYMVTSICSAYYCTLGRDNSAREP